MATIQPSIGPGRSDFYFRTKGATAGSFLVPHENSAVIARQPGYLMWAMIEIISTFNAPLWVFFFDANQLPGAQTGAPDATMLIMPPTKLLPGIANPIVPPYESIGIWQPAGNIQECQQFEGRRPIIAVQEPKGQPFDVGLTYALSTSDADLVPPGGQAALAYTVARCRSETR